MKTEMLKDMGKKELGDASCVDVFGAGSKNYPLCKAMVNHNQQRIMAGGWGEISDEVNRKLSEWKG